MEPIAISTRKNGEWIILHRCQACGTIHANRIAGDDNPVALYAIATRPLSRPPFPDLSESWVPEHSNPCP